MKVTLTDHTINPEYRIGHEAAICYDSRVDEASCIKRAIHCRDSGHLATMRFAYATVSITGISRVCSHQLVRIAIAGILQESQRYVKQTNIEWVNPHTLPDLPDNLQQRWHTLQTQAATLYQDCLDAGMKKQDARYILPQACSTAINLCMNFQGYKDFLANRTSSHAQHEIRQVALEIQRLLNTIAPDIFTLNDQPN